jgi:hypothetical protein
MVANVFLPPSDFSGNDNHPTLTKVLGRGEATFDGEIVFANVARSDAASLLPPGVNLALAPNIGGYPDTHPVIHMHGKQRNTSWIIDGQHVPIGNDYGEMMLLIPFVQIGNAAQWHDFVVRMYLEDPGAVALGAYFGYRKRLARLNLAAHSCEVLLYPNVFNPKVMQKIFTATHQSVTGTATQALPNWSDMVRILAMPILGVDEFTKQKYCSYFQLDFSAATKTPIECSHEYLPGFEPAFPAPGPMSGVPDGAVGVTNVKWRIDFPAMPC